MSNPPASPLSPSRPTSGASAQPSAELASPPPHIRRGAEHKYLIAFAVVLAALMQVIDTSIVNVALPDMMGTLGANLDQIAWVATGYILANVIVIPLTGWLGDVFGRKRYFVGSIILFTFASFMCGSSGSLELLIFWRVIQGIGGGALMTVSQAVLFESFPAEEAGMAMALFGLGVMVGPTIGPTLGGWITDNYNWPWIFYINIPIGILAAIMIATYVHDTTERRRDRVDYIGIGLLIVSVGAIQYVLEYGQQDDWFASRLITALTVAGAVGGGMLVWRELTTARPAIDFRVLRHRQMWVGTLLAVVLGVALYASVFTLPVFLQNNLRITAEQTGLVLLPGALATALSMVFVGRLSNRVDPRLMISAGAVLFAISMWDLSRITSLSGRGDFFVPLIFRGVGLGMMFVPLTTLTLAGLSNEELPQGTGLYNFFRQLGGSLGIAAIATLVTTYTAALHARLTEHVAMTDPLVMQRLAALTRGLATSGGDPVLAHQRALKLLDLEVQGQASVLAYSKVYVLSAILILALIPLLALVRRSDTDATRTVMLE